MSDISDPHDSDVAGPGATSNDDLIDVDVADSSTTLNDESVYVDVNVPSANENIQPVFRQYIPSKSTIYLLDPLPRNLITCKPLSSFVQIRSNQAPCPNL
jgi:hypothetical protein